jgi:FkbM family methyltransferase
MVGKAASRRARSATRSQTIGKIRIAGTRPEHIDHVRAWRDGHERTMATRLAAALKPGMTVIDAGAYLGYFTLIAAERVGPAGRVVALEPHPESYAALVENVRENGFEDRVTTLRIALADQRRRRSFTLDSNPARSKLDRPGADTASIDVECASLDDLVPGESTPDLIKVDVEGEEVSVLAGMGRTLTRVKSGFVMIVELNPDALLDAGTGPGELLGRLGELGLRVRVINEITARLERPDYRNLLQRQWVNLWLSNPPTLVA